MGNRVSHEASEAQGGDVLRFTVPGKPRGKGRPRFGRTKTGAPVTFTDAKTASYENLVKLAAREAGARLTHGPVLVKITAWLAIPKSAPKSKRAQMIEGFYRPCSKPDADNIAKAVLDGLNGVAFADDVQVVGLTISKFWTDEAPGLDVEVIRWPPRWRS